MSRYRELIKNVLEEPELILKGREFVRKAVRYVARTHLGPKYLVVVYRGEAKKKVIITAYFTSDLKRIKGEVVWRA